MQVEIMCDYLTSTTFKALEQIGPTKFTCQAVQPVIVVLITDLKPYISHFLVPCTAVWVGGQEQVVANWQKENDAT